MREAAVCPGLPVQADTAAAGAKAKNIIKRAAVADKQARVLAFAVPRIVFFGLGICNSNGNISKA